MAQTKLYSVLIFSVGITLWSNVAAQTSSASPAGEGDALLRCGELTDVTQISLCLSKAVSQVKKSSARNYGYPHRIAPTLPPFLRSNNPSTNDIDAKRRIDEPTSTTLVKRIQIYSEPGYRNFLDLDATLSQRVLEYRPVYGDFPAPVIFHQGHPPPVTSAAPYQQHHTEHYHKPVKPRTYAKKAYGGYYKNGGYQKDTYDSVPRKEQQNEFSKNHHKYADNEYSNHYKSTDYDQEYYVPANSPIIDNIRRSLLDYSGARDLMVDEPDYLGSGRSRQHRIKEIERDYYPFRRSDVLVKDLEADESHKPAQAS